MNKQEFLNELQSRIRILEEAEQQDILAEYAQHIDLRTAGGSPKRRPSGTSATRRSWPRRSWRHIMWIPPVWKRRPPSPLREFPPG